MFRDNDNQPFQILRSGEHTSPALVAIVQDQIERALEHPNSDKHASAIYDLTKYCWNSEAGINPYSGIRHLLQNMPEIEETWFDPHTGRIKDGIADILKCAVECAETPIYPGTPERVFTNPLGTGSPAEKAYGKIKPKNPWDNEQKLRGRQSAQYPLNLHDLKSEL